MHEWFKRDLKINIKKHYYDGLTYKAIGEQENLSPSRVRTIVVTALYKLKVPSRRNYIMYGKYQDEVGRLERVNLRLDIAQKELDKAKDVINEALITIQENLT